MAKKKTSLDFIKAVRGEWIMKPITRVQDNEIKNKKKRRQDEKKLIKDDLDS